MSNSEQVEAECPSCASFQIMLTGVRVSTDPARTRRFYRCIDCGHEWREGVLGRRQYRRIEDAS